MSSVIEMNLDLKADVEKVYQFISDPQSWTLWPRAGKVPGIVSASGRVAVGEIIKFTTSDGAEHEHHVVELIPNRKIHLHLKKVGLPVSLVVQDLHDIFEFEPIPGGMRLHRRFEILFRPNVIAEMVGRALFVQHFARAIEAHHAKLVETFGQ